MTRALSIPVSLAALRRLAAVLLLVGGALVAPATVSFGEPDDAWPVRAIPMLAPAGFLVEGRYADDPAIRVVPIVPFRSTEPRDVPAW